MHQIITLQHYFGPYAQHPAAQAVVLRNNAQRTIDLMNAVCAAAEADGVELEDNPATGSAISGSGNGGFRPPDATVGATGSRHKDGAAGDRYDPRRALMAWCLAHQAQLAELGCYCEHPQWTRSWAHLQWIAPGSGNRFFVPYSDLIKNPPTCAALPEQAANNVRTFNFKEGK